MLPFKLLFYTTLISLICIISTDHAMQLYQNTLKLGSPAIQATITDEIPDEESGMQPGHSAAPESINPSDPGTNSQYRSWISEVSESQENVGTINVTLVSRGRYLVYGGFTSSLMEGRIENPENDPCGEPQQSGNDGGISCQPCMTSSWPVTKDACINGIDGIRINNETDDNAFSYLKLQWYNTPSAADDRDLNRAPSLFLDTGMSPDSAINAFNSIEPPSFGSRPTNPGVLGIQYEGGKIIFQGRDTTGATPSNMASAIHDGKMAIGTPNIHEGHTLFVSGNMVFNRGTGKFGAIAILNNPSEIDNCDALPETNIDIPPGLTTLIIGIITIRYPNSNSRLMTQLMVDPGDDDTWGPSPVDSAWSRFRFQNGANEEATFFNTMVITSHDRARRADVGFNIITFGGDTIDNTNCRISTGNLNILSYSIAADSND